MFVGTLLGSLTLQLLTLPFPPNLWHSFLRAHEKEGFSWWLVGH